jgi:hypothetical protein
MVVNKFESLEARFGDQFFLQHINIQQDITIFYTNVIENYLHYYLPEGALRISSGYGNLKTLGYAAA